MVVVPGIYLFALSIFIRLFIHDDRANMVSITHSFVCCVPSHSLSLSLNVWITKTTKGTNVDEYHFMVKRKREREPTTSPAGQKRAQKAGPCQPTGFDPVHRWCIYLVDDTHVDPIAIPVSSPFFFFIFFFIFFFLICPVSLSSRLTDRRKKLRENA